MPIAPPYAGARRGSCVDKSRLFMSIGAPGRRSRDANVLRETAMDSSRSPRTKGPDRGP
jgi:hypothetical protein